MRHDKKTMNHQRQMLALMGFLLPLLAPILGFIAADRNAPDFWHSISATFYATSNWLMIGTLAIFAFFLFTYKGYDLGDNVVTTLSGTMAVLILVFPCACEAAGDTTGILNLPTPLSHAIHCVVAGLLFGSFAFMIGFRFTKTDKALYFTPKKKVRNTIYKVCAYIIFGAMALQIVTSIMGVGWMTIVNEAIMLWAFSFAWAVKADTFKFLND